MIPFINNDPPTEAQIVVKVGGKISDGKGGFLEAGEPLPEGCDTESLKDKGLI